MRAICCIDADVGLFHRMLAVMTMNSGYFLSVLAGTLVGSVLLGGYTAAAGH